MIIDEIKAKAEQFNVDLTENALKIAKAREMMKCGLDKCICHPQDTTRYCISKQCLLDIMTNGQCNCKCYRRKDE